MGVINYLDFDLIIEPLESPLARHRARVINSPSGQASIDFDFPFSPLEMENFFLRVGRPRRKVRRTSSPEIVAAKNFGAKLFDTVFQDQVRDCLRRSLDIVDKQGLQGLRLRLRLTNVPTLVDLPWEFLYDTATDRFLCHSLNTPIVRYLDLPQFVTPLEILPPLNILVMIANPMDNERLDIEAEWHKIHTALTDLVQRFQVTLTRIDNATLAELQRQLRRGQYHIFHFIGHGGFDQKTNEGMLVFEDENELSRMVSGHYLGTLLHDHPTIRLVLLNACEGARTSSTDPFAGVAQHLVQQGIPAVIAMQFEITDEAAIILAHEFYAALVDNYPVDAALTEARKAIFTQGNNTEWGTPVLYMRSSDGQLFTQNEDPPSPVVSKTNSLPVNNVQSEIKPLPNAQIFAKSDVKKKTTDRPKQRLIKLIGGLIGGIAVLLSVYIGSDWLRSFEKTAQPPQNPIGADIWIEPQYNIQFVYIPGGEVMLGSTQTQIDDAYKLCIEFDKACNRDLFFDSARLEQERVATVESFWIMRTEVTRAQYGNFIDDGGYTNESFWTTEGWQWREKENITQPWCLNDLPPEKDNYPIVCISWYEAKAYANWLASKTGLNLTLPSEKEWERAARGDDRLMYPWGNEWYNSHLNYCDVNCDRLFRDKAFDDGYGQWAPVGSYPQGASFYGVLDMVGNVWELTEDLSELGSRVIRGGSWDNHPADTRITTRQHFIAPDDRGMLKNIGMRLVIELP